MPMKILGYGPKNHNNEMRETNYTLTFFTVSEI